MKNTIKLFVATLLMVGVVNAATLTDRALATIVADKTMQRYDYNDSNPFQIIYNGTGTCTIAITSATIITASSNNAADSSILLSAAAYNTMGEVYDYYSDLSDGDYDLTIVDMRRAEDSKYLKDTAAVDLATGSTYYSVLMDSGTLGASEPSSMLLAINPSGTGSIRLFNVLGNVSGTATLNIYYEDKSANWAETLIWTTVPTTVTDEELAITTNDPFGGMDFDAGDRVILRGNSTTSQNGAASVGLYGYWAEIK